MNLNYNEKIKLNKSIKNPKVKNLIRKNKILKRH